MELLKNVARKSLYVLIPVLIASVLLESQKLPLGIFLGWFFGIINFRGLTKNIEGLTGVNQMKMRLLIFSVIRLGALFAAIIALVYFKAVNIFGLLAGFTIVFVFILIEGMRFRS